MLIDKPVVRACIEKWAAGQKQYGETFQGNALAHLYEELVDALNYCDQIEITDNLPVPEDQVERWRGQFLAISSEIRLLWRTMQRPLGE